MLPTFFSMRKIPTKSRMAAMTTEQRDSISNISSGWSGKCHDNFTDQTLSDHLTPTTTLTGKVTVREEDRMWSWSSYRRPPDSSQLVCRDRTSKTATSELSWPGTASISEPAVRRTPGVQWSSTTARVTRTVWRTTASPSSVMDWGSTRTARGRGKLRLNGAGCAPSKSGNEVDKVRIRQMKTSHNGFWHTIPPIYHRCKLGLLKVQSQYPIPLSFLEIHS